MLNFLLVILLSVTTTASFATECARILKTVTSQKLLKKLESSTDDEILKLRFVFKTNVTKLVEVDGNKQVVSTGTKLTQESFKELIEAFEKTLRENNIEAKIEAQDLLRSIGQGHLVIGVRSGDLKRLLEGEIEHIISIDFYDASSFKRINDH